MDDASAIEVQCRIAQAADEEISDGCARAIATGNMDGAAGASFATTGAISDPSEVWRDLFTLRDGTWMYSSMSRAERLAADMLGTYLANAGARGPVAGWSDLWVR